MSEKNRIHPIRAPYFVIRRTKTECGYVVAPYAQIDAWGSRQDAMRFLTAEEAEDMIWANEAIWTSSWKPKVVKVDVRKCRKPAPLGKETCTLNQGHAGEHQHWKKGRLVSGWF